jgi:glycosyltransferase involved in cell wall biosynthesis
VQQPDRPAIWITWEHHRRSRELSRVLSMELCELTSKRGRVIRYLSLLKRTTALLMRRRPAVVVTQCPSTMLGLLAAVLKPLLGFTFVADLHNAAIDPSLANPLHRKLLAFIRHTADLCIVSNANLVAAVERDGGTAFVLPDKLPELPPQPLVSGSATRSVVFVCTYASDEPWREVIGAARLMDPRVTVFITGDHSRLQMLPPRPDNVYLTGFLSERDYVALLRAADAVVDLTSLENCLVCGAYEAASLGKALVTSDTAALRAYFNRGTVYTKHDSASLAAAMAYALEHADRLAAEMSVLRAEIARDWNRQYAALRRVLHLDDGADATSRLVPVSMQQ